MLSVISCLLTEKVQQVTDMVTGGVLGLSAHNIIKLKISIRRKSVSKTSTLGMRKAAWRLLRALVSKEPWENAAVGAGVCQCWSHFKHHLVRAQEEAILKCQELSE